MAKVRNKINAKSIRSTIKQAHLEEMDLSTNPIKYIAKRLNSEKCRMEVLVTNLATH